MRAELAIRSAAELIERARLNQCWVATCESITGGGVGAALTSVPGASEAYRGGLITYATELKIELAGVEAGWVARHGVINEATAVQMALGVRRVCRAQIGLAVTGVAGPEPQDGQPPGVVWVAAVIGPDPADSEQVLTMTRQLALQGTREEIRQGTVQGVLALACEAMDQRPSPPDRA